MKRYIGVLANGRPVRDTTSAVEPTQPDLTFIEVSLEMQLDLKTAYWTGVGWETLEKANHSAEVYDYDKKEWYVDLTEAWSAVRILRDARLSRTDWMVTKAQETGQPIPQAWNEYRQALRDITAQSDPINIVWPRMP